MIAGGFVFSPEKVLYALVGAFVTRMTMEFILVKKLTLILLLLSVMLPRYLDKDFLNW